MAPQGACAVLLNAINGSQEVIMHWAEIVLIAISLVMVIIVARWWFFDRDSFYEERD